MQKIRGGEFHVGARDRGKQSPDEFPRFLTKLRSFCLDETEVTVSSYAQCVERGECKPSTKTSVSCNARHSDRGNHPMNCVDHSQATAFCASSAKRLPTEVEWEFAARGGKSEQKYPWGDASPDGRTCWKSQYSCEVRSFPAGAFGLYDMSGNVWEWTSSDYAPYPWSAPTPGEYPLKIYRGGGWSRRFEKWMHLGLRNRATPEDAGAHLGFRCASDARELPCPFERGADGTCLFGVVEVDCSPGRVWNGQRCAKPNDPLCPEGYHPQTAKGCVRDVAIQVHGEVLDLGSVRRERTSNFDPDCRVNQPSRPRAYRLSGSTHASRNAVAKRDGCKNRDVGAGWNSTCCP
ncbi:MAG TPA: SUMF1/EgtB/PvdO family nonheme iron enzyme [Polyangiaceae bacterium]|nr:SUMF1/EgtB/PvdO family nonheme iron enzyme [Polyangiaceae bacterium]